MVVMMMMDFWTLKVTHQLMSVNRASTISSGSTNHTPYACARRHRVPWVLGGRVGAPHAPSNPLQQRREYQP